MTTGDGPPAVLLGGDVTALAVARSLGSAGVEVHALGSRRDAVRRSRFCAQFVDLGAGEHVQERWLTWLIEAPPGAVVIPCSDEGLELMARHRASLLEAGLVPIEANDEVVLAMLDKQRTYALAAKAGIPVPNTAMVGNEDELRAAEREIGYPCALKPIHAHVYRRQLPGKGFLVQDRVHLERAFVRTRALGVDVMLTELIPGEDSYQACYGYLDENGAPVFLLTKQKSRQYPIKFGSGCHHLTDWDPAVAEVGLRFLRAVGLRGLAHVEFKRDARNGELTLIECNHRCTTTTALIRAAGVDMPLVIYNRAVGRPAPQSKRYRTGLAMWFPLTDLRAFREYRRCGELSFGGWARSLLRPTRFPRARWDDPLPMIAAFAPEVRGAGRKLQRLARRR